MFATRNQIMLATFSGFLSGASSNTWYETGVGNLKFNFDYDSAKEMMMIEAQIPKGTYLGLGWEEGLDEVDMVHIGAGDEIVITDMWSESPEDLQYDDVNDYIDTISELKGDIYHLKTWRPLKTDDHEQDEEIECGRRDVRMYWCTHTRSHRLVMHNHLQDFYVDLDENCKTTIRRHLLESDEEISPIVWALIFVGAVALILTASYIIRSKRMNQAENNLQKASKTNQDEVVDGVEVVPQVLPSEDPSAIKEDQSNLELAN